MADGKPTQRMYFTDGGSGHHLHLEASLTKPLIDTKSITSIPLCPVIPDTLSVAMAPQTLNKEEGERLELT